MTAVTAPPPSERRIPRWLPPLVLVAATLLTHGNSLANGFVWEDETIVVKNPDTRDLSRLGRVLLSPDEKPPYYRPLNRASYLVDYQLFGLRPVGFHAVNVALQVGSVLALFWLGLGIFSGPIPAFLAAALLAVHPVGCEAVAFVTARNNLFALLFSLLALGSFVRALASRSWPGAWLSAAWLLLALLSKEPAAMVLPVLATWLLVQRGWTPAALRDGRLLLPHLASCAVYLGLRSVSLGGIFRTSAGSASGAGSLLSRLAANAFTVPEYLWLVLFPRDLTIYHVLPEPRPLAVVAAALGWIALLVLVAWIIRRRSPPSLLGLAWFGFGLLPISNVLALPTTTLLAERFLFIPAVGLWIVAGDAFDAAWRSTSRRALLGVAAAMLVIALGVRSAVRNRDWKDDLSLARSAVEVEPRAPMARYNLGLALQEAGDPEGARRQWEESARLDRGDGRASVALGKLAADAGDPAAAEAHFRAALGMLVGPVEARLNLGKLYDREGRPDLARAEWEQVLRTDPLHPDANLQLGVLAAASGDLQSAESRFRNSLRVDPDMAEAQFNLARVLDATRRPDEAARAYERFLRIQSPGMEAAARYAAQRLSVLRAGARSPAPPTGIPSPPAALPPGPGPRP